MLKLFLDKMAIKIKVKIKVAKAYIMSTSKGTNIPFAFGIMNGVRKRK